LLVLARRRLILLDSLEFAVDPVQVGLL